MPINKTKKKISLKEYVKISIWSLKVTWGISKSATIIMLMSDVLNDLRGIVNTYLMARIIDRLISLLSNGDKDVKTIIPFLFLIIGINIVYSGISELRGYANRKLRRLSNPYLETMLYQKVNYLGPQSLELPDIANANQKVHEWLYSITDVGNSVIRMLSHFIKMIVAGLLLLKTVPIVLPLILLASVVYYLQRRYYFRKDFEWQTRDKHLTDKRKNYWTASRLSEPNSIGEVSVTGAYGYLSRKFTDFFKYYNGGLINIYKKDALSGSLVSVLSNFIMAIGFIQIFKLLLQKVISIGDTTFYMSTVSNFYDSTEFLFDEVVYYRDMVVKMRDVYQFFQLEPVIKDGETGIERFIQPPSIEINNMFFHYPNSKRNIFKRFSLKIEPGEKVAIVGENGSGKTTLVKLISRIYDPQEGEILVNGINLKDIKMNDWYKNIGVLFQDYNFYAELSAEENIYLGKSVKEIDRDKIIEASKNADAHDFIMKYPEKYKTVLSERFRGGIRPSNGQRQKIAIARFFYRNAPLAIFDEPTSAIDAESEFRIFNRIYDFFAHKTVLIISHRFSTVRNADRIIVIHDGEIVEEGTHDALLKKKGRYYNAFKKQAEGYK